MIIIRHHIEPCIARTDVADLRQSHIGSASPIHVLDMEQECEWITRGYLPAGTLVA